MGKLAFLVTIYGALIYVYNTVPPRDLPGLVTILAVASFCLQVGKLIGCGEL